MNKFKVGDTVIANKKSVFPEYWEEFKRESRYLQVGKVRKTGTDSKYWRSPQEVEVTIKNNCHFLFLEGDLTKVE